MLVIKRFSERKKVFKERKKTGKIRAKSRPSHLTVAVDYFFNNDLEYLKTYDSEKTYTTSITKTKAARYEIVGIEDMVPTLWSTIKHAYDKDAAKGIKHWGESISFVLGRDTQESSDELHHRILDFVYNDEMSRRKWTAIDKKRSELMVELIDKQMRERRIIINPGAIGWCSGTRDGLQTDDAYCMIVRSLCGTKLLGRALRKSEKGKNDRLRRSMTLENQQGVSDEVLIVSWTSDVQCTTTSQANQGLANRLLFLLLSEIKHLYVTLSLRSSYVCALLWMEMARTLTLVDVDDRSRMLITYRNIYTNTYVGYPSVLEGYSDATWINHVEDSSSTSGWVFLLGGCAISWASNMQTCITGSTIEYEFVALVADGKEAKWLKNLIHVILLWPKPIAPISIHCDSAVTLAKAYSQIYNGKYRHLGVRYSMIRELIMNGVISIEFVRSQHNLADHLTKALARDLVIKSVIGMGLKSI
ncbi:hypothetical protein Tco_0489250 [Tanacetum coccineum]